MKDKKLKWNIDEASIVEPLCQKSHEDYMAAQAQMRLRTSRYELYGLVAKNKSIHEWSIKKSKSTTFSEGSTQYILRKTLADTIQRVPDGELITQYDKASKEHIWTQYLFENKVMWSEFEGVDMMSNFTDCFKMSFIYGFAPVRTGFEKDYDEDMRVSFNLEQWSDVFINPDCKDIRRPQTVWFRQYMTKADVQALLNSEGHVKDPTYNEDTIKYILDHDLFTGKRWESEKLADKLKGSTSIASVELCTRYDRGASEFITMVPGLNARFRSVPNYDPRKGIPWNFLLLETDKDFPLGVPQVEFLLGDQQFNDLFQTSAFKNLLLAMEPPIKVAGWETNPSSYKFEPRKIWNLGNNPNQSVVEPVKIDNAVLSSWLTTREGVASGMLRTLNVMDTTIAKDSGVTGFSKTPQGVEEQSKAKTININQYQKRMEFFISDWANQALRMYINAMKGKHSLTVDEKTRRLLFDIGGMDDIDGNKITIDFDELGTDLLEFKVRTGSLVERKEEQELQSLQDTALPFVQNLQGWSDENKHVIENEVLLPIAKRMLELSNTDIGQTMAESLGTQQAKLMLADMQGQIDQQGEQLDAQGSQMNAIQEALGSEPSPEAIPENEAVPTPPPVETGGELSPSSAPLSNIEMPGEQVIEPEDLLTL